MAEFSADAPAGLISTLTRSGTWFHRYVLGTYAAAAETPTPLEQISFNLGVQLLLGHTTFPGTVVRSPFYNPLRSTVDTHIEVFDPSRNSSVKIVYVYRNPLDQIVSLHQHFRRHVQESRRMLGALPLDEYINVFGVPQYAIHFLTFYCAREWYPNNLMMCRYEDAVRNPEAHFARVLGFLGVAVDAAKLRRAIALCTRESLKAIEVRSGRSLAGDLLGEAQTHIDSGEIGRWRAEMTDGQAHRILSALELLGIDRDAIFADDISGGMLERRPALDLQA